MSDNESDCFTHMTREIMLKNIKENICDTYRITFQNEKTFDIQITHRLNGVATSINPPCIEDDDELAISCMAMLDTCLKSEQMYHNTFWVEMIRVIQYDDFEMKSEMSSTRILRAFLQNLISFSMEYPESVPRAATSNYHFAKAARFAATRINNDEELLNEMSHIRVEDVKPWNYITPSECSSMDVDLDSSDSL